MKRGGYLKRHEPLKRHARQLRESLMPQINKARATKRRAEEFGPQAQRCRELSCCSCHANGPSDPAHIRSRGAGGKDHANVVPLCRACHILQHQVGILTFQARCNIDLQDVADRISADLEAEGITW